VGDHKDRPYCEAGGGASSFRRHRHDAPAQYDLGRTLYPNTLLASCCSAGGCSCLAAGADAEGGSGGAADTAGVGKGGSTDVGAGPGSTGGSVLASPATV
jgi:hypothetical protein